MSLSEEQLEELTKKLKKVNDENTTTLQNLHAEGIGIRPGALEEMRFEMFVKEVLGDLENERRLLFELRVANQIKKALANTAKDARSKAALQRLTLPRSIQP
jgi:hypothetical protein